MRDPTFRQKMSERMWKCEGLFAEAKQNHGLARARYRGRRKVQIQAYLSATVQNLKRLVFLFYHWLMTWLSRVRTEPIPAPTDLSQPGLFQHARSYYGTPHVARVFETNTRPTAAVRARITSV